MRPALRLGAQQGRLMLGAGVEEEAGAGFDDAPQVQRQQPGRDVACVEQEIGVVRVQMMDIERERHAVIAGLRNQG